jgi:hypothetical protein
LSIHSIKHTGVLKSLAENGNDYELTKQYSHHSQTSTLFNYTNKNIDLTISPTYNFYNETDMSRIAESPQQDLVKVIMDCPEYIKKEIIRRLEMLNKNSL